MQGQIDLFTLLTLVVAVAAVVQLRKVLGQRTGDEDERIERRRRAREAMEKDASAGPGKVVSLPKRETEAAEAPEPVADVDVASPSGAEKVRAYAGGNAALASGLLAINQQDPAFEPQDFLKGAEHAYELIVTAFAEGNRGVLKPLLSEEAMDDFSQAIMQREKQGERIDQSFVGISKADILEAELVKGTAFVTVRFVSQLISATRNRGGDVIDGDPQRVRDLTDIWKFSRDISTGRARNNPNWKLVSTDASN